MSTPAVVDVFSLRFLLAALIGWLDRLQQEALAYLIEEIESCGVIDLASRRVHVVGSTPHPDEVFMGQVGRTLTAADEGVLGGHRVLIL